MKLITKAIENRIAKQPLYSQDGKGVNATIICKFFFGNFTWYVLEGKKMDDGDYELYGIVDNAGEKEYGYFYLSQLQSIKMWGYPVVERDMYFDACKVGECSETKAFVEGIFA